jgi:thiamine pyrophosphokinase
MAHKTVEEQTKCTSHHHTTHEPDECANMLFNRIPSTAIYTTHNYLYSLSNATTNSSAQYLRSLSNVATNSTTHTHTDAHSNNNKITRRPLELLRQ